MKREANFGTLFRHWLRANPMDCGAFELKQTLSNSIAFSAVKNHQLAALQAVNSSKGLLYKIPDDSRGIKPFDFIYLREACAYVVIKYPKCFCIIHINNFIFEMEHSKRKSLTLDRAQLIASVTIDL